MIIPGRAIADEIASSIREQGQHLRMTAVTIAPSEATRSYMRIKQKIAEAVGITFQVCELDVRYSTDEVIAALQKLDTDALIVQLPLPSHLDEQKLLTSIPIEKDVDVLSLAARNAGILVPPVAAAVDEVLKYAGVKPQGKRTVVIGKGKLVGEPVAMRLAEQGADVHTYDAADFTRNVLQNAEIIISGAGVPHLIKPEFLSYGVVLIDAGTSEFNGSIAGDIDPACADVASVYTPVPGGIGPITVACLMRNAVELYLYKDLTI